MTVTDVKSSHLQAVGYDPTTRTLEVHLAGGGKYEYPDVSPEEHQALMSAESHGRHFNQHIRKRKSKKLS